MNGAPMPPDPTAPPDWFLLALLLVGIVFALVWLWRDKAREKREQKQLDAAATLARAILQEEEELEEFKIQSLINQSPGGRKPWQ